MLQTVRHGPNTVAGVTRQIREPRSTVRRLMTDLERDGYLVRDMLGRYLTGPNTIELGKVHTLDPLQHDSNQILNELTAATDASACLFWADGINRTCIAASASSAIKVGTRLAPSFNSSAQVLFAWSNGRRLAAREFPATADLELLTQVRKRGWASCSTEQHAACVSAPVRNHLGEVIAAVTVMGCAGPDARRCHVDARQVVTAGKELTAALERARRREKMRK
ncbi:MAG: hypothetical protein FWG25_01905 [Promicromonosporaceae bacterium]|nr:hypothetical protein [Promicromonosporaceae bacterium]